MRRETRYCLSAPALFSWQGASQRRLQGEGVTRDVSPQGAFIRTATLPPPGCPVQVDLLLPSLTGIKTILRMTGKARVIRVDDPAANKWAGGFAVLTDNFSQWGLLPMQAETTNWPAEAGRAH